MFFLLERPNTDDDEYQDSVTYLPYDNKDKHKTRYVLKIFDLEKMTNLSEFIVCHLHRQNYRI